MLEYTLPLNPELFTQDEIFSAVLSKASLKDVAGQTSEGSGYGGFRFATGSFEEHSEMLHQMMEQSCIRESPHLCCAHIYFPTVKIYFRLNGHQILNVSSCFQKLSFWFNCYRWKEKCSLTCLISKQYQ